MKIAVSGSKGLLGSELVKLFKRHNYEVVEFFKPDHDITDEQNIDNFFKNNLGIEIFFNCAAYTNVILAETENELADKVNNIGAQNIAKKCCENNIRLIHFSTDFVFDGKSNVPYIESDMLNPVNTYGLSKMEGEFSIWFTFRKMQKYNFTIFRVQWLYGDNENNFFKKIYNKSKSGQEVTLPLNEIGSPTHVSFISEIMLEIVEKNLLDKIDNQIFNISHDDYCSRFECGILFLKHLGLYNFSSIENFDDPKVKRPKFTVLDNSKLKKLIDRDLGSWKTYLLQYAYKLKLKENN